MFLEVEQPTKIERKFKKKEKERERKRKIDRTCCVRVKGKRSFLEFVNSFSISIQICFKFAAAVDQNKSFKQINLPIFLYNFPISVLPFYKSKNDF